MKQEDFENKNNDDSTYNPNAGSVTMYQKGGILKVMNSLGSSFSFMPRGECLVVGQGPEADHFTIQAAIDAAVTGDHIVILRGTYTENLTIAKKIFILGESTEVIINGNVNFEIGADYTQYTSTFINGIVTIGGNTQMIRLIDATLSATGSLVESLAAAGKSIEGVTFTSVKEPSGNIDFTLDGVSDITTNVNTYNVANLDDTITHNGVGTTVLAGQLVQLRSKPERSNIYIILQEEL